MEAVKTINFIISIVFIVCYTYQFVYILVPFVVKDKRKGEAVSHRYAVLVSARNEEAVIGNLIESIKRQTYDGGLVTTFVVADNCTDDTARVAADAGAIVFERFDTANVGKGYALNYLLHRIDELFPERPFDGYFVFDADNVLEENYIEEMNKVFSQGYGIVTSYRNSKNFGDNWISSGYALWFLRESQFLNHARFNLGTSCAVSGTGFLFSRKVLAAGTSTCSPRTSSSPSTTSSAASRSATVTTPSSTTSSPPASVSPGGSACAGRGATCRCSASTARTSCAA